MTTADVIRRAAMGKVPRRFRLHALSDWLGQTPELDVVREYLVRFEDFWEATNDERRMFLLFCAEALEPE